MMERRTVEEHRMAQVVEHTFNALVAEKRFEIQTSGGKQTWNFKKDANGDLLVQPPHHRRYTKVLYPASTLTAIAKGNELFELKVNPMPETETEDAIKGLMLMVRIEPPCFA